VFHATLGKHLQEQSASAADVQNDAFLFRLAQRAFDEVEMIAYHESPVPLLQPVGRGSLRNEPVVGRIILAKIERRRLGRQTDQPALTALDDLEDLGGGVVKTIGGGKQDAGFCGIAGGAGFPSRCGRGAQGAVRSVACAVA
jgi:hypothetical protein